MAQNFRIIRQGSGQSFRFSLVGDFDSLSAIELADALGNTGEAERVVVCTSCLGGIEPGGVLALGRRLATRDRSLGEVLFTGWRADILAPPGSTVFHV
ncbi:MAG: hypothetical protein KKA60_15375 [Proteobacteria bacterium]|nr:hypothetical protein [Pseudomonadota bacterium]